MWTGFIVPKGNEVAHFVGILIWVDVMKKFFNVGRVVFGCKF